MLKCQEILKTVRYNTGIKCWKYTDYGNPHTHKSWCKGLIGSKRRGEKLGKNYGKQWFMVRFREDENIHYFKPALFGKTVITTNL